MSESLPPKVGADDQVILFDGVCKMCSGWTHFILRYDTKRVFKLCSLQSDEGQAILKWFGLPTENFETVILVQGGTVVTKSTAVLTMFGQLPFPWKVMSIFKMIPAGLRDWLYGQIARNRYKIFGQNESCLMPTPQNRQRFL